MAKNKQDIIEALDISSLPQAEQEEVLLDLQELVYRSTLIRLIERMDEATQTDFNVLLDSTPDEDVVLAYLYEKVPDADDVVGVVLSEIQNDILSLTDKK